LQVVTEHAEGPMAVSGHIIDYSSGASVPNVAFRLGDQQFVSDVTGASAAPLLVGRYTIVSKVSGTSRAQSMSVARGPVATCLSTAVRAAPATDRSLTRSLATHRRSNSCAERQADDRFGWMVFERRRMLGCGACNTTYIYVSANGYVSKSQLLGRGYSEVQRLDIPLDRGHDPH